MARPRPFWSSLVRNRRGAVCTLCVSLLLTVVTIFGTWSARCFLDHAMHPLPDGTVPLLAAFLGTKGWQYREDARAAAAPAPGAPPPPAP